MSNRHAKPASLAGLHTTTAHALLVLVLIISPLFFGSVERSVWWPLTGVLFLALANAVMAKQTHAALFPAPWAMFGATVAGVWMGVQMLPGLPATLHHPVWAETRALLSADLQAFFATLSDAPFQGTISLNPEASLKMLVRFAGCLAAVWAGFLLSRGDHRRARRLLLTFVATATFCAFYGLYVQFQGLNKVLWLEKIRFESNLTGPFINRNHFACYMGMALVTLWGVWLHKMVKITWPESLRLRLVTLATAVLRKQALYSLAALILILALMLTGSRAGLATTLCGVLTVAILFRVTGQISTRSLLAMGGGMLLISMLVLAFKGDILWQRITDHGFTDSQRVALYDLAWEAMQDRPLLGHGAGSFRDVFRLNRDARFTSFYSMVHNDYLQAVVELGWPMALVVFASMAALVKTCVTGVFTRRRNRAFPIIGCAVLVQVGLHAVVDFSLHIPAVAWAFCVILGLSLGQSESSRQEREEKS